jgi:hypothetical protein
VIADKKNVTPTAAIAAVRATIIDVFFAEKARPAVAAFPGTHMHRHTVYKAT